MTERLYYNDSYACEFDAAVVRVEPRGSRLAVWLDRTAFYPTSGGQPFDTGTLDTASVVTVEVDEADDIVHLIERSAPLALGRIIRGVVGWPRRFDHMQQHTGQHVLSAAFNRLFEVRTIGFHLGAERSTIDLSREMTVAEMAAAESEANRIVWEDRTVAVRYASAAEAEALPLRKESGRDGTLRLIEVEGFDLSACGGTHVSRTGAIGVIAIGAWERVRGGHRVLFFCGARVLALYRKLRADAGAAARLLSVVPGELPAAVERLQAEGRDQRGRLADLQSELTTYRAGELAQSARATSKGGLVLQAADLDAVGLKALAVSVTERPCLIVVLVSQTPPAVLVVARSADVALSAHEVVQRLAAEFGGRGGGKADLAQGGGLHGSPEKILERAGEIVAES